MRVSDTDTYYLERNIIKDLNSVKVAKYPLNILAVQKVEIMAHNALGKIQFTNVEFVLFS